MSETFDWPDGQRCAVSLTYDDGLAIHHERAGPALERAGLRGTFYVPVASDLMRHPVKWRELAARGHELGNHSLFHPCRKGEERAGWDWLDDWRDLRDYTPARFRQELEMANLVLHLVDGKHERTYGNTCCDTTIGRGDEEAPLDDILADLFVAARGPGTSRVADVRAGINLMQVGCYGADGQVFADLRGEIERAAEMGGWIVWMIHGVGEGVHQLYLEEAEHDALVSWLGANRSEIWTAPLVEVARHVRSTS